jgi:hypothetical protein
LEKIRSKKTRDYAEAEIAYERSFREMRLSNALVPAVDEVVLALKVSRLRIQLLLCFLGSPILLTTTFVRWIDQFATKSRAQAVSIFRDARTAEKEQAGFARDYIAELRRR